MSYKENKHFKKYCCKHGNIEKGVQTLELFCKNNNVNMDIFGSITRKDYYYGKSDCDTVFITNNVDHTSVEFENFIRNNKFLSFNGKKYIQYSLDVKNVKCSGVLFHLIIEECKFDVMIVNKKDYSSYNDLITPTHNFILMFVIAIVKFFYYKVPLIPESLYRKIKNSLLTRRLHVVKSTIHK